MATDSLVQGIELAHLRVYPDHEGDNAQAQTAATPDLRFAGAMADDLHAGPHAEVQTKQLMRALAACQHMRSNVLMVAVGGAAAPVVHLLCVSPSESGAQDLALHIWLPVRDDGD